MSTARTAHGRRGHPQGRMDAGGEAGVGGPAMHAASCAGCARSCAHAAVSSAGPLTVLLGVCSPRQEDELLVKLVNFHGTKNWSVIAKGIKGRTGKSCRIRCGRDKRAAHRLPIAGSPASNRMGDGGSRRDAETGR